MVEGFIDSASAYEIVLVLARDTLYSPSRMEWDRALEVTAALITTDRIKLAPSPRCRCCFWPLWNRELRLDLRPVRDLASDGAY